MIRRAYLRAALAAVLDGIADRITAAADAIAPRTTGPDGPVLAVGRFVGCLPADDMTPDRYEPVDLWPVTRCGSAACTCAAVDEPAIPVGEYPALPNVPAPTDFSTAGSGLVPGGATPAAAGDHSSTSQLLGEAAAQLNSLGQMAYSEPQDWLDDFITQLHERAEAHRRQGD